MALSFRALYKFLLPGNYTDDDTDGGKVQYTQALINDAYDSINRERLTMRFPSYAGESALALIGADRAIPRGRSETAAHYANRLIAWRYPRGHRTRGSAFALLEQIWEYFGGGFALHTEQQNQQRWHRSASGAESTDTGAWDWDSDTVLDASDRWARFWVVIDGSNLITPTPDWGDPALYGGQHGDSSYALGHDGISAGDVNAIRRLFRGRAWNPAGTRPMWAIISLDGSQPSPSGAWQLWAKEVAGNYTAARSSTYRYWALSESLLQYAGDPAKFPLSADMPGGGTEGGDPDVFPTSSPLVSGLVYQGNPANFPASARLVDDGSIP